MFTTVNEVRQILAALNASRICEGNSEPQYTSLPSIREGVLKNQSSELIMNTLCTCMSCNWLLLLGTDVVAKVDSTRTGVMSVSH